MWFLGFVFVLLCFSCVFLFWVFFFFVSYLSWGLLVYFVVVGFFGFFFLCVCVIF